VLAAETAAKVRHTCRRSCSGAAQYPAAVLSTKHTLRAASESADRLRPPKVTISRGGALDDLCRAAGGLDRVPTSLGGTAPDAPRAGPVRAPAVDHRLWVPPRGAPLTADFALDAAPVSGGRRQRSRPRTCASFGLLTPYSHRNARGNPHLSGQPNADPPKMPRSPRGGGRAGVGALAAAGAVLFDPGAPGACAPCGHHPGEKDAKLAQKLGQLRPFMAVFPQGCMGQLASFGPT
jgi:hypothetical protein